jgi:beta-glucosidase
VHEQQDGAVACDHYNRYREDVGIMTSLGLNAYRFSVAWPRIIPDGTGAVNSRGLDFYDRLVDELLAKDIIPFVTLYHWDLPQSLEDRGGWYSRDIADAFGAYTTAVVERLGDRVTNWITLNEPWVHSWLGYGLGVHAPGRTDGPEGAVRSAHNLLRAHGQAVQVVRNLYPESRVGITFDLSSSYPATDSEDDTRAAELADISRNRWFLDPVLRGSYPTGMANFEEFLPADAVDDLRVISAPLDFVGVNYYSRMVVTLDEETGLAKPAASPESSEYTDAGWEIFPQGLGELLLRLRNEYGVQSIFITENGAAYNDGPSQDGTVADSRRREYLEKHFKVAGNAISQGVPLDGYFIWSLLDNFEWAKGYDDDTRFGIVHVDFETQDRVVKESGKWYAGLISAHRSKR